MANHLVQAVLSLGLSIVVILCIVALVARNGYLDDDELMNTKAVYTMCKPTEYKDECKEALKEVSLNASSTKKDYIFAPFYSILKELQKGIDKASSSNLNNCEKLLGRAAEELNQVLKVANKTKIAKVADQADPILIFLTAVRAYQTTCIDEIPDGSLKKDMNKTLEGALINTFNAEKITYNIADILLEFGVDLGNFHFGHRRLLEEEEEEEAVVDSPAWFSAADRTLLGGGGGGGDDKDDDDEDGEDDDKKKKDGYFKKPTCEDYFKTPQPEKLKRLKSGSGAQVTPDVVVAKDGSGDYKSIKKALDDCPKNHKGRYIIYIKAGTYKEGQLVVTKDQCNVFMYGDGRDKTIITGDLGGDQDGGSFLSQTATFIAIGERFIAKSIGFKNTAQAVAFLSQSPHSVMVDCSFEGSQNTVYYLTHDQFYKNCSITGSVDFLTGSGRAFFQDCEITVTEPEKGQKCYITADRRMKYEEAGGVVLQKCKIKADKDLKGDVKTYLGRPWKPQSTAVVIQSNMGDFIDPEGWSKMEDSSKGKKNHKTCMFKEYGNKGPGSDTEGRVKWKGFKAMKNKGDAGKYTPDPFMEAKGWLPNAGVKVEKGIKY